MIFIIFSRKLFKKLFLLAKVLHISYSEILSFEVIKRIRGLASTLLRLSLVLLSLYANPLYGQLRLEKAKKSDYTVNQHTILDGLPHNYIKHLFMDSRGILWINTTSGMSSFDGYNFRDYEDEYGFETGANFRIYEDQAKNLWFWFYDDVSLTVLNSSLDRIVKLEELENFPFRAEDISNITTGFDNIIYLTTKNNQVVRLKTPDNFEVFDLETDLTNMHHIWIQENEAKNTHTLRGFLAKSDSLKFITFNKQKTISVQYEAKAYDWIKNTSIPNISEITEYHWHLCYENKPQTSIPKYYLRDNYTFACENRQRAFYDSERNLFWIKVNNNLVGMTMAGEEEYRFALDKTLAYLPLTALSVIPNGIAFSLSSNGLFILKFRENKFTTLVSKKDFQTRNILKDSSDNLWVNSVYELTVLNDEFQSILHWDDEVNYTLLKDHQQNIWFPRGKSLYKYNTKLELIAEFISPNDKELLRSWSLYEMPSGEIWMFLPGTIFIYSDKDGFKEFTNFNEFEFNLNFIYHVQHKGDRQYWLCTSTGLFILDLDQGIIARYHSSEKGEFYLPAKDFHHMHIDEEGVHWLVTGDAGLIEWQPGSSIKQKAKITSYSLEEGMPSKVMHAIYEDDSDYLWISSEFGIIQFHKKTKLHRTFTEADGIANNEHNRISHYRHDDGTLYFGGVKGITLFHPDDFTPDSTFSPVSLSSIRKLKNGILQEVVHNSSDDQFEIFFEQSGDYFELNFATTAPSLGHRFSYSLNDQDNWVYMKDGRMTLSNLPFGNHDLYVRKTNIAGQQLGIIKIPVKTPYPFYLQLRYLLPLIFGVMAILWLINYQRIKNYKQRQLELEALVSERTQKIEADKMVIDKQAHFLQHLNETRTQIFNNIAHELRNPLTLILGGVKILEKDAPDSKNPSTTLKYLNNIEDNTKSILNLSNEILHLSRMDSEEESENNSLVAISMLLEKVVNAFQSFADFQKKELVFDNTLDQAIHVHLDVEKFEKIVNNLISNALKYSPQGSKILITAAITNQGLFELTVNDNGFGIAEEDLPFIFEPFYRSKQIAKNHDLLDARGGFGIGLSIVKKIVKLLKGNIDVKSKMGEGSRFTVQIPLKIVEPTEIRSSQYKTDSTIEISPSNESLVQKQVQFQHILLVEDHQEIQQFIVNVLEPFYQVSTANNGKAALELLEANSNNGKLPIVLIISDIMMPEMDGVTFLDTIRSLERWKDIPFLFLSGYVSKVSQHLALEKGVDHYLVKPFNPEVLLAKVAQQISKQSDHSKTTKPKSTPIKKNTSYEEEWVQNLYKVVYENIDNRALDIPFLSDALTVSRRQLTRKVKAHTGLSPGKFITEARLQKAREMLENKEYYSVSTICYATGFKTPKYFSKQFQQRFGRLPSSYFE